MEDLLGLWEVVALSAIAAGWEMLSSILVRKKEFALSRLIGADLNEFSKLIWHEIEQRPRKESHDLYERGRDDSRADWRVSWNGITLVLTSARVTRRDQCWRKR